MNSSDHRSLILVLGILAVVMLLLAAVAIATLLA